LIGKDDQYLDPNREVGWNQKPTAENLAAITVAEDFSGNKDWGGTHNIDSFGTPNGDKIFQIAQDFDLGAIVLGDIAHYWKGEANASEGQASLQSSPTLAKLLRDNKADVEKAYKDAQKYMIAAKAIASDDGKTTTDSGFLEAQKRIQELYALPELSGDAPAEP